MKPFLTIDGSHGEGGGQILRTALSLSCLLKRPIVIEKIRAGRKNPGLQPQHLTSVKAAKEISRARIEGAALGSQHLTFEPQVQQGGEYTFDVSEKKRSAGSVGLVFQTLFPILAFSKERSRVKIKGGTHTAWSPPFHYLQEVFLPNLSKMGLLAHVTLERCGFYPMGGGEISVEIDPVKKLVGKEWIKRNKEVIRIRGISTVANLSRSIAERQREHALKRIKMAGFDGEIQIVEAQAKGRGSFLFIEVEYDDLRCGFSALGERGKPAEKVADEACEAFLNQHHTGRALDPHMADQILLYAALAEGNTYFTTSKITRHLLTNLWVLRKFLPVKVQVSGEVGEEGSVAVEGLKFGV